MEHEGCYGCGCLARQLADAQATVEALQAQYSELLEALDCVLAERPLPSGEYVHRISCSGDRRKPAGTVGISCSCRVGQQQVEALQRERDHAKKMAAVQKEVADNQTWHVRELTAALDAEREKVANTEKAYQEKARLWIEQTGALSQLQALVRALPVVNGEIRSIGQNVVNGEHNYLSRLDSCLEAGAYTALLQYRATLDATPTERGQG